MIEKYTLSNGIPVFVVESHASPVVSVQAWVSRGSVFESEKIAGISHFLEHALFKGTKKRMVGQIASEIESRGGEINAFTSFEETAYYCTLASRYLETGLDVIGDALQNPLFDPEEMEREKEVILEEIKRSQDSPYRTVSSNLWKTSFDGTSYGRPVLGFTETVKNINSETLRKYFRTHYHAGTTSVFIVGDVEAKKALEQTKRFFGKMKGGPKGNGIRLRTPQFSKPKIVAEKRDVQECHIQMAFRTPGITHPNIAAIDLACSALGQGESSRLFQRMVKESKAALDAQFGLAATSHCGLGTLSFTAAPDKLEEALQVAGEFLQEALDKGLNEEEMERVKSSLETDVVSGKETAEGYARRLGYYYIQFGDPEYEKRYLETVLGTERDEAFHGLVSLLNEKPVLSIVHPMNVDVDKTKLQLHLKFRYKKRSAAVSTVGTLRKTIKGNIRFISKELDHLPMVALRILFPGGMREESSHEHGLVTLFQRTWTSGTETYNSLQIAHTLEALGASLYAISGKNTFGLTLEFLSKHWPIVKPLLREVLLCPTFPSEEVATEKSLQLREIQSERDLPAQVCQLNFMAALYGDHPYGRSSLGTTDSVAALTSENLSNFYKQFVHQKNAVVATVGDVDTEIWNEEIYNLMKGLPTTGREPKPFANVAERKTAHLVLEKKAPLFQSHVMVGFLGASLADQDRFALKLLSSCLAGQGGRLFLELRDKQSLAYTVAPMVSDNPERGLFAFYIGCSPEKLERSLEGIRVELDKILQKPISPKELQRAKEYWIGRFELDMQRYQTQAMLFGIDEMYGIGFDHAQKMPEIVKSITADQIQKAAIRFLNPETATLSIVHNEDLSEDRILGAWKIRTHLINSSVASPREKSDGEDAQVRPRSRTDVRRAAERGGRS